MKNFFLLMIITILIASCSMKNKIVELETDDFKLSIDDKGSINELIDKNRVHINYPADWHDNSLDFLGINYTVYKYSFWWGVGAA